MRPRVSEDGHHTGLHVPNPPPPRSNAGSSPHERTEDEVGDILVHDEGGAPTVGAGGRSATVTAANTVGRRALSTRVSWTSTCNEDAPTNHTFGRPDLDRDHLVRVDESFPDREVAPVRLACVSACAGPGTTATGSAEQSVVGVEQVRCEILCGWPRLVHPT